MSWFLGLVLLVSAVMICTGFRGVGRDISGTAHEDGAGSAEVSADAGFVLFIVGVLAAVLTVLVLILGGLFA